MYRDFPKFNIHNVVCSATCHLYRKLIPSISSGNTFLIWLCKRRVEYFSEFRPKLHNILTDKFDYSKASITPLKIWSWKPYLRSFWEGNHCFTIWKVFTGFRSNTKKVYIVQKMNNCFCFCLFVCFVLFCFFLYFFFFGRGCKQKKVALKHEMKKCNPCWRDTNTSNRSTIYN